LAQVNPRPGLRRQLRAWLKAGVLAQGTLLPPEAGTMQGSPLSPLRATIALHGLETALTKAFPRSGSRNGQSPTVVVYADDLVIRHRERPVVERGQQLVAEWLRPMGRALQPHKTRSTHTRETTDDTPGCDFLSFHLRQYPVGKPKAGRNCRGRRHGFKTRITPSRSAIMRQRTTGHQPMARHKPAAQHRRIDALTPRIRGGSNYYRHVSSAQVFRPLDNTRYMQLRAWAMHRHPHTSTHWIMGKYWRIDTGQGGRFQAPTQGHALSGHAQTPLRPQVKVQGTRSPYDGAWVYGSIR
jgi:RNA-directed DNA polymerase